MGKVYAVSNEWFYYGDHCNVANEWEHKIDKIFDSKEKAMNHILNHINKLYENVWINDSHPFKRYMLDKVPTIDDFDEDDIIVFGDDTNETARYLFSIIEYDVE